MSQEFAVDYCFEEELLGARQQLIARGRHISLKCLNLY